MENEEVLLGIDYGERNIGLAFGRSGLVFPLTVVSGKDIETAVNAIGRFVLDNKVARIIVGLPLSVGGKETTMSQEVRKFAKILRIRLKKPVTFVNEYRSSKDSIDSMLGLGISKRHRKVVDHFSAAVILKFFYEAS